MSRLINDIPAWLLKANMLSATQGFDITNTNTRQALTVLHTILHPSLYLEIDGDATYPIGEGHTIIVHCCNDIGAWGAGFVLALNKRWQKPMHYYRDWYAQRENPQLKGYYPFELGNIQLVQVANDIGVCNLIGQRGVGIDQNGNAPIRYEAIQQGLQHLVNTIQKFIPNASIHMPMMGAGLAGGDWEKIKSIVHETVVAQGIPVIVYRWKGGGDDNE